MEFNNQEEEERFNFRKDMLVETNLGYGSTDPLIQDEVSDITIFRTHNHRNNIYSTYVPYILYGLNACPRI